MNIVLLEPEIPQNAGNIIRLAVVTGSALHMIKPLGFKVDDKYVKRAGMDYIKDADISYYDSFDEFIKENNPKRIVMSTTKAKRVYSDFLYGANDYIMFGKESAGIPEEILRKNKENCVRIPMMRTSRSINLANSVSIVLYEALRQNGFNGLLKEGELHHSVWN